MNIVTDHGWPIASDGGDGRGLEALKNERDYIAVGDNHRTTAAALSWAVREIERLTRDLASARAEAVSLRKHNTGLVLIEAQVRKVAGAELAELSAECEGVKIENERLKAKANDVALAWSKIDDAHNDEVAQKDAEIERLNGECIASMSEIASLRSDMERLRKGIQDYFDGNYGHDYGGSKIVTCPHGMHRHEPCEACIDEHFQKVLGAAEQ